MIKVFIADDHKVVLNGLPNMLRPFPEVEIIGKALNGAILLEQLKTQQPDVILLDIEMPVIDGIGVIKTVRKLYPNIKILIFTTYMEKPIVKKVTKIGVDGYLVKDSDGEEIVTAMKKVLAGGHYYDEQIVNMVMSNYKKQPTPKRQTTPRLTKRQKEIAILIAIGKTTKQIAKKLYLSPSTVDTHRRNIYDKLGLDKAPKLAQYARDQGWIK